MPSEPSGVTEGHNGPDRQVQSLFTWIHMNSGFSGKTVKCSALVAFMCLLELLCYCHMQAGPE